MSNSEPDNFLPYHHFLSGLTDDDRTQRANDMLQLMRTRRSIRSFSNRPVSRDLIETCIRVAGTAPSGANHQPWYFVAISNPDMKQKIRIAAEQEEQDFYHERANQEWLEALKPLGTDEHKPFLETAPWLIAVFSQKRGGVHAGDDGKNYYVTESVGLATGMLITALHTAGLCVLTHTPAPMGFLTTICDRPKSEKPFVLLVVGHAKSDAKIPRRAVIKKDISDISEFKL